MYRSAAVATCLGSFLDIRAARSIVRFSITVRRTGPLRRWARRRGRAGDVWLDGTLPDDEVIALVDTSYQAVVAALPKGKRPGHGKPSAAVPPCRAVEAGGSATHVAVRSISRAR